MGRETTSDAVGAADGVRQRVHDHLQSLSLNFSTGARAGALMHRALLEATTFSACIPSGSSRHLSTLLCLLIALIYMLALSSQMTIVSLILSPLALITRRCSSPARMCRQPLGAC